MDKNHYKILAVDDNPQNIKVIGSILRKANYRVGFAFNGQQALDLLSESNDYDLILLDVNMPVMNGYEACVRIREKPALKEIPIIFLTALSELDNIVRGFDSGAQDYVTKPFNGRELLARVQTHVELKRSKEKLKETNVWLEEKVNERTQDLKIANEKLETTNLKLEETNRELELLDEAKVDFLRLLSHEINTPLNGVMGFTSMLKEELEDPAFYEMLSFLDISAKRLEKFASVSLLITELKTKQKKVYWEDIDVDLLVKDLIANDLRLKMDKKGIKLSMKVKENIIWADKKLLEISFESLLDNAIKFSPDNGLISINIYKNNGYTCYDVEDEGQGFRSSVLKNPFQLFAYGQDHADEDKGLSLALVKLIMDAHLGEIEVSNKDGGGALVRLCFRNKSS